MPILLYLSAPGSDGLFADDDPAVRAIVEQRFVAVRLNPYHRADVAMYYDPGGWPALLLLLPDGRMVAHAVDIPPDNVRLFLLRLSDHFRNRNEVLKRKIREAAGTGRTFEIDASAVYAAARADFDPVDGGFGAGAKFVEPLVMRFLLQYYRETADEAAREMVWKTLDAVLSSPLWDAGAGSVWAFSHTPDWSTPHELRDGAQQANLLQVLLEAAQDKSEYAGAARRLLAYIEGELFDGDRGVFLGRQVMAGCTFTSAVLWKDPAVYADRNALLVRALLKAAQQLGTDAPAHKAVTAATFLRDQMMTGDGEVYHCLYEGQRQASGLLADQMVVSAAFADVYAWNGDERFREAARRVLAWSETHQFDDEAAVFYQGAPREISQASDKRGMNRVDVSANSMAAELYWRNGEPKRARRLLRNVRANRPAGRRHAPYARVALQYGRE